MKQKDQLTNEQFQGICKSNFDLTLYAISLGRYFIKSGHEATIQNVLDEIRRHPNSNYLNELIEMEEAEDKGA